MAILIGFAKTHLHLPFELTNQLNSHLSEFSLLFSRSCALTRRNPAPRLTGVTADDLDPGATPSGQR